MVTDRIKKKSVELLGYEIDTVELRLMPYIMHVVQNGKCLDARSCNKDDYDVLYKWREAGYCKGILSKLTITKEFWVILCEIVFLGYVDTN